MTTRPQVAIKIAECIAEWSDLETVLGLILSMLLNADAKTALAMYLSVENRAAQFRMLQAAATAKLPSDHADTVLTIISKFIRPAMRERDKLAHWCWGYSPDLPDALLLMEPDEKMALHLRITDAVPRQTLTEARSSSSTNPI